MKDRKRRRVAISKTVEKVHSIHFLCRMEIDMENRFVFLDHNIAEKSQSIRTPSDSHQRRTREVDELNGSTVSGC